MKKSPEPVGFIGEFYQTFDRSLTPSFFKLLQKNEEARIFPNTFYDVRIILIHKPGKDLTRHENYRPISLVIKM